MGKYLLSAFADEYSGNFDTQLAMLTQQGVSYIEPRFLDGKNISSLDSKEVAEIKKKLDACGIGVSSIGSPLGKIKLDEDFDAHMEMTKRTCETACALETKNIRMFSFYLREGLTREDCRAEVLEKLNAMLEMAESYGLTFCHENEAKIYGESPESCLDLLTAFNGRLACVFDMGNFVLGGYKPYPDAYILLKDYIRYFHIKDSLYRGAIVPPGCGEASIADILKDFAAASSKDVFVTLEPHLETFDGLNRLVGQSFENPYKFESAEVAFLTAMNKLKELIP